MALTHHLSTTTAAQRPAGVTCEKYVPGEGRRCLRYLSHGGCTLPGVSRCTEWLKANGQAAPRREVAVPSPAPVDSSSPRPATGTLDLFGHPLHGAAPKQARPAAPPLNVKAPSEPDTVSSLPDLRGLTTEDIASFKALGAEVCFRSETYGEVWLVPAYTGQSRKELTPEHAATLVRVLSAFPGSRVMSFEKRPASADEVSP
ncbi:hypothetical protein [Myxococcus qinghaiensis]|uniref:hypothetical protein n=1 Tax=Myxococcus qinghaiensis TaxID=2906758 RepID=UPI0020A77B52|nr:hypothetical protein [Myxococcus qinghaiensis]MCP3170161.1 hypothetical protein [Myxococcus qinghaiensis]